METESENTENWLFYGIGLIKLQALFWAGKRNLMPLGVVSMKQ